MVVGQADSWIPMRCQSQHSPPTMIGDGHWLRARILNNVTVKCGRGWEQWEQDGHQH